MSSGGAAAVIKQAPIRFLETDTQILRAATLNEIEALLLKLGGGNHGDNMQVLQDFATFFLADLAETDFLGLIFLQNEEVLAICPRGQERTLGSVAHRAAGITDRTLSPNWNLAEIVVRTKEALNAGPLRPLVLRQARNSESQYGSWYLQDGSHSALGYAIALMTRAVSYCPVRAYCATNARLGVVGSPARPGSS